MFDSNHRVKNVPHFIIYNSHYNRLRPNVSEIVCVSLSLCENSSEIVEGVPESDPTLSAQIITDHLNSDIVSDVSVQCFVSDL